MKPNLPAAKSAAPRKFPVPKGKLSSAVTAKIRNKATAILSE